MTDYNIQVKIDPTQAKTGANSVEQALKSIEDAAGRLGETLKSAFELAGIGLGIKELADFADSFAKIENSVRLVTNSADQMQAVMAQLYQISQDTGTSFEQNAAYFQRLAFAGENAGVSLAELLKVQKELDEIAVISNKDIGDNAESFDALTRALVNGTVNGRQFNQLIAGSPVLLESLAKGLGMTVSQLRYMSQQNELTGKQLLDGLVKAKPLIDNMAAQVIPTLTRAYDMLKNAVINYVGTVDDSNSIVAKFTEGVQWLATNLDVLSKILQVVVGIILYEYVTSMVAAAAATVVAMAPLELFIAILVAVGAALYIFSNSIKVSFGDAGKTTVTLYDLLKAVLSEIWSMFQQTFQFIANTVNYFASHWNDIVNFFKEASSIMMGTIKAILDPFGVFDKVISSITENVKKLYQWFASKVDDGPGTFLGWIKSFAHDAHEGVTAIAQDVQQKALANAQQANAAQELLRKALQPGAAGLDKHGPDQTGQNIQEIVKAEQDLKDILKGVVEPIDDYKKKMSELNLLLQSGRLNQDQYNLALQNLAEKMLQSDHSLQGGFLEGLINVRKEFTDLAGPVASLVKDSFKGMEDALVSFVTTGKLSMHDLVNSIIADLARIAVRQNITAPLASMLGSIIPSLGSLLPTTATPAFGGGHAAGGPTTAGTQYLIGEQGPELWTAGADGYVTPNKQLGGGNVTVNVINNANGTKVSQTMTKDGQGNKTINVIVDEITAANLRSSSSQTSRAMRDAYSMTPTTAMR